MTASITVIRLLNDPAGVISKCSSSLSARFIITRLSSGLPSPMRDSAAAMRPSFFSTVASMAVNRALSDPVAVISSCCSSVCIRLVIMALPSSALPNPIRDSAAAMRPKFFSTVASMAAKRLKSDPASEISNWASSRWTLLIPTISSPTSPSPTPASAAAIRANSLGAAGIGAGFASSFLASVLG
eukprot:CAMPEP_0119465390 /NCGR_PEP_ID=MMETSP1344-20130328/539_1 /TAXON_ID=236787 /ORGANISM="Florenciella parvula, Strain CCMP2471" /LENGTH=184 /DNA_ID=CAMNT_0007497647 /DNA_START=646 /DNA_END=1196 /DNA_ORIENTATION=-